MARPKEFDKDEVLGRAVEVFWQKGYEGSSLADLVDAMGISRQSLYDTFGDKHALFLAALARYRADSGEALLSSHAQSCSLEDTMRTLLMAIVDEPAEVKQRGCFVINSAMELLPRDEVAAKVVADHQKRLEALFLTWINAAVERGEITQHHKPRALARFFVMALEGLRVAAKTDPNRAALRDMVDVTLAVLDKPPHESNSIVP